MKEPWGGCKIKSVAKDFFGRKVLSLQCFTRYYTDIRHHYILWLNLKYRKNLKRKD